MRTATASRTGIWKFGVLLFSAAILSAPWRSQAGGGEVVLLASSTNAQQTTPGQKKKPPQPTPLKVERPLTNADIVKMVKVGLGDDVIIAKIKGAPSEALDVSIDGLV